MELLTIQEVQKLLKISRSTIYRMQKRGVLKRVRLPETEKVLFDLDDINALIEASKKSNG